RTLPASMSGWRSIDSTSETTFLVKITLNFSTKHLHRPLLCNSITIQASSNNSWILLIETSPRSLPACVDQRVSGVWGEPSDSPLSCAERSENASLFLFSGKKCCREEKICYTLFCVEEARALDEVIP